MSRSDGHEWSRKGRGDPLTLLLAKEARTCKGCVHRDPVEVFGERHYVCCRGRKEGRRCKSYEEAGHVAVA